MRRRWAVLVAGVALGLIGGAAACTALFSVDGYDQPVAPPDAPDAPPDCNNGANACAPQDLRYICGQSPQYNGGVHGVPGCLYTCINSHSCSRWCDAGCVVEAMDAYDHCAGEAPDAQGLTCL